MEAPTDRPATPDPEAVAGPALFYPLAFALSWLVWGLAVVVPGLDDWEGLLIILGAYGPFVSALIVARRFGGARPWFRRVAGLSRRWRVLVLGGLLLPLLVVAAHLVLYRLFAGSVSLSADPPWYWAVAASPVNVFILFWLGSGVEEFGWQGMGVPGLLQHFRPPVAAVVHGVLWGIWHLPLYLLDSWDGGSQTVVALFAITITLSPIMIWLTGRAAGGVLPAVLFHTATNHYSALFTEPADGSAVFDPPLSEHFDLIKIVVYLSIAAAIVVLTRARLGATAAPGGRSR
jgi:membrane protease YdiL (CAAX protease family)